MQPSFNDAAWLLGRARFGYGLDYPYNTTLPDASTGRRFHYFRTSFCLSATRKMWLANVVNRNLALKVLSDNGADVYLNGFRLLADATNNHDPFYWNNEVALAGNHAAFVQGELCGVGLGRCEH